MKEIMEKIGIISFVSFDEIYNKRDFARKTYATFDQDTKEVYKWYYYHQLCLMTNKKMPLKDYLWLYIAGRDNIKKELKKEYTKFYKKREKIISKEGKYIDNEKNLTIFDLLEL